MRGRLRNERWQELAPHLDRALELTGEQRLAWLDTVRAEDAALALDLEALLEEHSALEQEGFLEGSPPTPPASGAESTHLDPIGPYRILRELGRGGMGRVYLAEQEGDDFRRLVALRAAAGGLGALARRARRLAGTR